MSGATAATPAAAAVACAGDKMRVAVYLGASQPVHGTHTAMVRALLDAGHQTVFLFLLRWRPERFGTSAAGLDVCAKLW